MQSQQKGIDIEDLTAMIHIKQFEIDTSRTLHSVFKEGVEAE